jgi:hypothetical protein
MFYENQLFSVYNTDVCRSISGTMAWAHRNSQLPNMALWRSTKSYNTSILNTMNVTMHEGAGVWRQLYQSEKSHPALYFTWMDKQCDCKTEVKERKCDENQRTYCHSSWHSVVGSDSCTTKHKCQVPVTGHAQSNGAKPCNTPSLSINF